MSEEVSQQQLCQMQHLFLQLDPTKSRTNSSFNCSESLTVDHGHFNNSALNNKNTYLDSNVELLLYTVLTPLVVLIGLVGNCLCIRVFSDRRMRKQTASIYFAALAVADLSVLILYVIPEWLHRGLSVLINVPQLNILANQGVCQIVLYFSYTIRLLSVWMLVTSTVERYIGVCHPLIRRRICSAPSAKRIIALVVVASCILCIWKPVISQVSNIQGKQSCTYQVKIVSVTLDTIYAAFLTIIPSFFIILFNVLISRHLLIVKSSKNCLSSQELVGVQFAVLLIMVSTCFLVLTWPYYIAWLHLWKMDFMEDSTNIQHINANSNFIIIDRALFITRVFYYLTYSVNFFLYNFASGYFRSEMKRMFTLRIDRNRARRFYDTDDMRIHSAACNTIDAADEDAFIKDKVDINERQLMEHIVEENDTSKRSFRLNKQKSVKRSSDFQTANDLVDDNEAIIDMHVMRKSLRLKKNVTIRLDTPPIVE